MHFGAGRTAPSAEQPDEFGCAIVSSEQSPENGPTAEGSDSAAADHTDVNGEIEVDGGSGQDTREDSEVSVFGGGEDANKVESQEATSESEQLATGSARTEPTDGVEATAEANGFGDVQAAPLDVSADSAATAAASVASALASATLVEDNGEATFVTEAALKQLLDRCLILHRNHFCQH